MVTCKAILCVALTLWQEARSESHEGRMAVASVIMNRTPAEHTKYDIAWTVLRPRQFSCWNNKDTRNLQEPVRSESEEDVWQDCVDIAQSMVDGTFKATTSANHYYNPSRTEPWWGSELKDVSMIGNHKFGRM